MTRTRSDSSEVARDGAQRDTAVEASPAALEVINHLGAAHGALMFFQSGGCCDGGSPMCLKQDELPLLPRPAAAGIRSSPSQAGATPPMSGSRRSGTLVREDSTIRAAHADAYGPW
jgi:Protein of unknown function (DUF779)